MMVTSALPASLPPTHFWHGASAQPLGEGKSVNVSPPCTNPGLFPLYQYTSKLLSCKVTSEVLFNLSVCVLMHA